METLAPPTPETALPERIRAYNAGRQPDTLALKYAAMREDAFRFFRGTCHLFYNDLPADLPLLQSPPAWLSGDLHLENFGSYKGDNRLTYFDINDFDEARLAPALLDPARLLTSLHVAARELGLNAPQTRHRLDRFADRYAHRLAEGYIRTVERASAEGVVRRFLKQVSRRRHADFLKKHVDTSGKTPRLRRIKGRLLKADRASRHAVADALRAWADAQPTAPFGRVCDVVRRVAGTGSLGQIRYAVLVEDLLTPGKREPYALLDLKQALPPGSTVPNAPTQPVWSNQADRIVWVQMNTQAMPPARLTPFRLADDWYVLRELQPAQDRIDYDRFRGRTAKLDQVLGTMADLCAWGQLRTSGRHGAANADALIAFGQRAADWKPALLDYARHYAERVQTDFAEYAIAYDDGAFTLPTSTK